MDDIRSCYETTMRFFKDSDLEIPVRWFFADTNAKEFPTYSRFASGNWAANLVDWTGPGEVLGSPRRWVNGSVPPFDGTVAPGFLGQTFVGSSRDFADGVSFPGRSAGGAADGTCAGCIGQLPFALCPQIATLPATDIRMEILAVTNPATPPIGHVGDVFIFPSNGPGLWGPVVFGPYPPFVSIANLTLECPGFPDPMTFVLHVSGFGSVFEVYNPWQAVTIPPAGPLDLEMTWLYPGSFLADLTSPETWTMRLTQ